MLGAELLSPANALLHLKEHILGVVYNLQQDDHEDGLELCERYLDISQRWFEANKDQELHDSEMFFSIELVHAFAANFLVELDQFDEALVHLNQLHAKHFFQQRKVNKLCNNIENIAENPKTDVDLDILISTHLLVGGIWFKMKNFEKSLYHLQISFGLKLSQDEPSYILYFNCIGSFIMEMEEYENAFVYFNPAVKLNKDDPYDADCIEDDAIKTYLLPEAFQGSTALSNFINCLLKLKMFEEALENLNTAMQLSAKWKLENWQIQKFTSASKKKKVKSLAKFLCEFGMWYKKQNYYKEAAMYLQNSFCIYKKLNEAKEISSTCAELLHCHMQMYQRERSEKFVKDLYQSEKFDSKVAMVPTSTFAESGTLSFYFKSAMGC